MDITRTNFPEYTSPRRDTALLTWLLFCCFLVFSMVILGGVTRLTDSGLSMVDWEPVSGVFLPISDEDWQIEFESYKKSPEYLQINFGMTLSAFKKIFYYEYAHRMLGRLIGVIFGFGFLWFLVRRRLSRRLSLHLALVFLLGGVQGLLGWYMVQSGLVNVPHVSQYRLTAHLGVAIIIYLYLCWLSLSLLENKVASPVTKFQSLSTISIAVLVFITVLSGGFVAGLDAGQSFNTFPLMGGEWVPENYRDLEPIWRNIFENIAAVQFNHRLLAFLVFLSILGLFLKVLFDQRLFDKRVAVITLLIFASAQVILGVSTLLSHVFVPIAAVHQGTALLLLTAMIYVVFKFRNIR